jgi:hypothetical protein
MLKIKILQTALGSSISDWLQLPSHTSNLLARLARAPVTGSMIPYSFRALCPGWYCVAAGETRFLGLPRPHFGPTTSSGESPFSLLL